MLHNILITGASGYLGGTLLSRMGSANLPPYGKLYALVRTQAQADAVKQYGAQPLMFDPHEEAAVRDNVAKYELTVVYYLIDAVQSDAQVYFIRALADVRKKTGKEVHLLHTTGAKIFSSHAGVPKDQSLLDTASDLYDIQKAQRSPYDAMQKAIQTNCTVVEEADKHDVRSYIFTPCIVYGKGEGFQNIISIQTVAIVKAATALRQVYRVDSDRPVWPVCHVIDNTTLYLTILRKILLNENPGHGRNGYYLAASGHVTWDDIYDAMATSLAKHGVVKDSSVLSADESILEKMGLALGCPKEFVPVQLGGHCAFAAKHGEEIGWRPRFDPRHILDAANEEVDFILLQLKNKQQSPLLD